VSRRFGIVAPFWVGAVALGVLAFALLPIFTNRALAEVRG